MATTEQEEQADMTKTDLINYYQLCTKIEDIAKTIKHLERDIYSLPATKDPNAEPDKLFGSKVENLVVLKEIYESEYLIAINKRIAIERWINSLPTEREQNIIRHKYIHRLKFWQIANVMNYAIPHVKRLHREIMDKLKS